MNSQIIPRRQFGVVTGPGRRAPVRLLGLAVAVTLLATLLVPLAGTPLSSAAAQEPAATEEAGATQTDGETQDSGDGVAADLQADPYTSGIHINMHKCDRDHGSDFLQWSANCTPGGGFEFDVYGGGVLSQSAVDYLSVKNLPAGNYRVHEYVPRDYRNPTVFCSRGPSNGNGAGQVEVATYDGYYEFTLGPNEAIYCHWFNLPFRLAPDGVGELWLYKRPCPANPSFDYYTADINQFYHLCDLYDGDAVSFSLYSHVSGLTDYRDNNNGFSSFIWEDVPAGQVTITESGWNYDGNGPPLIYCTNLYPGAPAWFRPDTYDVYASFWKKAGVKTACHWFTIPLSEGSDVADTQTGSLDISAYTCPEDEVIEYATANVSDLQASCQRYYDSGITFDLYNSETGQQASTEINPLGSGFARFADVDGGPVTIEQSAWDGYGHPIVFCSVENGEGYDALTIGSAEWSIGFDFPAGKDVDCDWFIVPADAGHDEDGSVTVIKYTCDERAIDEHADLEEYLANCPDLTEGVFFKLDGASSGNPGDYPTDAGGQATWTEREADRYYLSEELPTGYGIPVVYCSIYPAGVESVQSFERFAVSDEARIEFDLGENEAIYCYWFNIPDDTEHKDTGHLAIYAYFCPERSELEYDRAGLADLESSCGYYTGQDVGFDLYSHETGETETRYTGDPDCDLEACWRDVPGGDVTLTGHTHDGYGQPVVSCGVALTDDSLDEIDLEADDWSVAFAFPAGETVLCAWFNIPESDSGSYPGGNGTATVTTYACPEGAGLEAGDFAWYQNACNQPVAGISFTMLSDGYQSLGKYPTDANGQAGWTGLAAERHYLFEDLPSGYGKPAVFCDRYLPDDAAQPNFERYGVSMQEAIQFFLTENESIRCSWFNLPLADDVASATITMHICPPGFDAANADIFGLAENCQDKLDGIPFYVYTDQEYMLDAQSTGDSFDFGVSFVGLPPADLVFAGNELYGYGRPIVYCEATDQLLQESGRQQVTVERDDDTYSGNYHVTWGLNPGDSLYCDWFNVSLIDSPDAGTLTIYKYVCQDNGIDYYSADAETIDRNCASYYESDVTFDYINHTSGDTETQATEHRGQENSATVVWAPTLAGPVTVTEHAWDGYGTPNVWCGATVSGEELAEIDVEVDDLSADFEIPAGEHVVCQWFNIPDDDGSSEHGAVWIYTYFCPADEGFDYYAADEADFAPPDGACAFYEGDHVGFDLASHTSGETLTRFTDPSNGYNASWNQVSTGGVTITEHAQAGYGSPRVFCGVSRDTAFEYFPVEVVGWSVDFEIGAGQSIICFWFNIPSDADTAGQIVIYTWECPADIDTNAPSLGNLYESCYPVVEEIDFRLAGERPDGSEQATDDMGMVRWNGVASGEYGLTQTTRSGGYGEPIVYCDRFQGAEYWSPERWPVEDGTITFTHVGDEHQFACDWFNMPGDDTAKSNDQSKEGSYPRGGKHALAMGCEPIVFTLSA